MTTVAVAVGGTEVAVGGTEVEVGGGPVTTKHTVLLFNVVPVPAVGLPERRARSQMIAPSVVGAM
jgi:hypothetical protein